MSKLANHIGVVSQSRHMSFSQVQDICAAIELQLSEDAYHVWGRRTHITAFNDLRSVPHGYWRAFIQDDIHEPGAAGYHTDENNQPVIFVQYDGDDTSLTLSHEAVESIPDPFGNRLIPVNHPEYGAIQILCEICDPPEDVVFSYKRNGIKVSDFIRPEWYDTFTTDVMTYSFNGHCKRPLQLLPGGYYSFIQDGLWKQATWFNGDVPIVRTLGKVDPTQMLREWIDSQTAEFKALSV